MSFAKEYVNEVVERSYKQWHALISIHKLYEVGHYDGDDKSLQDALIVVRNALDKQIRALDPDESEKS